MPKPYVPNDAWSKKAQKEGFRARSVYKLMQLDERFHFFQPGIRVLDIGAAPGSWLQYVSKVLGPKGKALGLDLQPIAHVGNNVVTAVCDVFNREQVEGELAKLGWKDVHVVLSDIAPNTSGIVDVDQWKSVELSMQVMEIATKYLRKGGALVMKVFRGKSFDTFIASVKKTYHNLKIVSVDASRDRSREVYVVCYKP